jgi:hypothetical protein
MVHGMENVLVADGSVFPSSGAQNPTLTILATTLRNATKLFGNGAGHLGAATTSATHHHHRGVPVDQPPTVEPGGTLPDTGLGRDVPFIGVGALAAGLAAQRLRNGHDSADA